MFRFTIRDVLWLTVVAALIVGWWLDQDRIRREREALRAEREKLQVLLQRLQPLPLSRAEKALQVAEAELASLLEIRQRNPGAVSASELRKFELQRDRAQLDVEQARAKEEFASAANPPATPNP